MSKEPKYPSRIADHFNIRFPAGMREVIRKSAEENGRSMNQEIVYRIQNSYAQAASSGEERLEAIDLLKVMMGSVVEVKERDGMQEVTFQRPLPVPKRD
jgi:molybdopterin converting factor small subunit